jgi:hypothetical protein
MGDAVQELVRSHHCTARYSGVCNLGFHQTRYGVMKHFQATDSSEGEQGDHSNGLFYTSFNWKPPPISSSSRPANNPLKSAAAAPPSPRIGALGVLCLRLLS